MKQLLFVCLGNICRSPAAQGITQSLVERHGIADRVRVESAGTANYQVGKPPDATMTKVAADHGYPLKNKAKQLTYTMVLESDLVIAMDRDNYRDILQIARGEPKHIQLLSDFLGDDWPRDVPDPYRGPESGFSYVLEMLELACPRVLEKVLGEPLLGVNSSSKTR